MPAAWVGAGSCSGDYPSGYEAAFKKGELVPNPEVKQIVRPRLEKDEQADTVRLLTYMGSAVYVLGTRRPAGRPCPHCGTFVRESQGTRQTPGVSDLIAFLPGTPRLVLFIEQKRAHGGRLSPAQEHFRTIVQASTARHVSGSLDDVITWLTTHGYLGMVRGCAAGGQR
jgi:hypothetical protein